MTDAPNLVEGIGDIGHDMGMSTLTPEQFRNRVAFYERIALTALPGSAAVMFAAYARRRLNEFEAGAPMHEIDWNAR